MGAGHPHRYVGRERYYQGQEAPPILLGLRYYLRESGRFMARDQLPDTSSDYRYAGNGPAASTDATGMLCLRTATEERTVGVSGRGKPVWVTPPWYEFHRKDVAWAPPGAPATHVDCYWYKYHYEIWDEPVRFEKRENRYCCDIQVSSHYDWSMCRLRRRPEMHCGWRLGPWVQTGTGRGIVSVTDRRFELTKGICAMDSQGDFMCSCVSPDKKRLVAFGMVWNNDTIRRNNPTPIPIHGPPWTGPGRPPGRGNRLR